MRNYVVGLATVALLALGQAAMASHFTTLAGQPVDPQHNPGKKAAILFFVAVDCPNSNAYSPFFNSLVKDYAKQGVAFYVVHEDDGVTRQEAEKHAKDYGYTCPVMLDADHSLAKHYKIEVTPEVAIVDAMGKELYRGRIDDRFVSCGSAANGTTHELTDALGSVLAGKAVAKAYVPGAGCSIYYKP
jgi:thiol-disulfide isomerase/thioredoxin